MSTDHDNLTSGAGDPQRAQVQPQQQAAPSSQSGQTPGAPGQSSFHNPYQAAPTAAAPAGPPSPPVQPGTPRPTGAVAGRVTAGVSRTTIAAIAGGAVLVVIGAVVIVLVAVAFSAEDSASGGDGSLSGEWSENSPGALVDGTEDCYDTTFTLTFNGSDREVDGASCDLAVGTVLDATRVDFIGDAGWAANIRDILTEGASSTVLSTSWSVTVGVSDEIGGSDYTLYYLDTSAGMSVEVESFGSVAAARLAAEDLGM